MIIGLVGAIASGKGEAVNILKEAGFGAYSLSDEVRAVAQSRGLGKEREVLVSIGNELRANEPAYFARQVAQKIIAAKVNLAVVDGIRNPAEALYLQENLGMILVAVNASEEIRLQRYLERSRIDDTATVEAFQAANRRDLGEGENESGQQVAACIAMADIGVNNDGDREELVDQLLEIIYFQLAGDGK